MLVARVSIIVNIIILINDATVFLTVIFITVFRLSVCLSSHTSTVDFQSTPHYKLLHTPFYFLQPFYMIRIL